MSNWTLTEQQEDALTPEESRELSDLLFRCYTDQPFDKDDLVRMMDLEMKAKSP